MKKTLILLSSVALLGAALITGCKKDSADATAPVVYVTGDDPMYIIKGNTTTDPGATATDDVDGSVVTTSSWSATNPNINTAGTYTVTYSTKDAAGNTASDTRTVYVVDLAGLYINAFDSCATTPSSTFDATVVTAGAGQMFSISNFGANGSAVSVNCKLESNGNITVATGQSLGGAATITTAFNSTSKMLTTSPVKFQIKYGWNDGSGMSDVCTSTYTK